MLANRCHIPLVAAARCLSVGLYCIKHLGTPLCAAIVYASRGFESEGWAVGEITEMTSMRISMFPSTFSQPAGTLVLAEDRVVTSVDLSTLCVAGFVLEPRPSLSSPGLLLCLAPGRYSLDVEQRHNSHCDNEQDFPSF